MIKLRRLAAATTLAFLPVVVAIAQPPAAANQTELRNRRWAIERELEKVAVIERKLMVPMRDGVRMAADVYYPKDASRKHPAIFVRTPYNFNFWDVTKGRQHHGDLRRYGKQVGHEVQHR